MVYNHNDQHAFSLIELMVVIAVIGILAAIAIPSYKKYLLTTRMSQPIPYIDRIMQDSFSYYNRNGSFPNAQQLNLGSGYYLSNIPNILSFMGISPINNCSKMGFIYGSYNVGYLPSLSVASFTCIYADVSGILKQQCFYNYSTNGAYTDSNYLNGVWLGMPASNSGIETLVPGWQLENTTINSDTNNFATYYSAFYSGAGCP